MKLNQHAFPFTPYHCGSEQAGTGLTKRELFAALALAGNVAGMMMKDEGLTPPVARVLAEEAVDLADALLAELDRSRDE